VVGRLAARHGVRVRLRHAQAGGLTALIWLPDTVAAPEVAPPLGRLRRFEADDYGPAASLSAPTVTAPPNAASQATAAARIPRFSPTAPTTTGPAAPTVPAVPAAPSLSPATNAGAPAGPDQEKKDTPAEAGTPAGNNWEPAGNGWDLGNVRADHDGPSTPALPVRNGNGNARTPSNGNAVGDGAEPRTPASGAPDGPEGLGGPSRLPAFTGLGSQGPEAPQFPIGSQNIHGSDGPSAADAATGGPGQEGPGAEGDAADSQVTVPPVGQEQRLPIFDSLESDWFRRSGKTLAAQRPQGAQAAQPTAQGTVQGTWTSPADEGWRAAQVVASPAAGETTQAGLPRRVPRANLVPGSVGNGGAQGSQGSNETEAETPVRSPDAVRSRMASFQRGVREGRAATPQIEEP
jgi:hypothetical protein